MNLALKWVREEALLLESTAAAQTWSQARTAHAGQQDSLRADEPPWALMGTLSPGPLAYCSTLVSLCADKVRTIEIPEHKSAVW